MIDINLIRTNFDAVASNLEKRGVARERVQEIANLDEQWRKASEEVDTLRAKQNEANDKISAAPAEEKKTIIEDVKHIASELKEKEGVLRDLAEKRLTAWKSLPNLTDDTAPVGGEQDFEIVATSGTPNESAELKHYLDLVGNEVDVDRAAKVSGSRFAYVTGHLARLEFALVSFAMDTLMKERFTPVIPPVLLRAEAMSGMGYLDHEGDEIYKTQDDLYLAGTSEQPIGAMHADEVLDGNSFPKRYVGFSTCFRREAGSHGKDVRGMLRVHQFDKVEMFSITTADTSKGEHEFILSQQRKLLDALELPYRVINIASGDLGASAAKKYDIETWLPGEKAFRETNSTSNTTDYQSRRLNIRYTNSEGKKEFAHMLNGTAFAIGRILIALVENHQQPDGSIAIPKALHPYLPFTTIEASA